MALRILTPPVGQKHLKARTYEREQNQLIIERSRYNSAMENHCAPSVPPKYFINFALPFNTKQYWRDYLLP